MVKISIVEFSVSILSKPNGKFVFMVSIGTNICAVFFSFIHFVASKETKYTDIHKVNITKMSRWTEYAKQNRRRRIRKRKKVTNSFDDD